MLIEKKSNLRILVVDDEEAIRDSFRLVLCPPKTNSNQVDAAAAALFDEAPVHPGKPPVAAFDVEFATNGREALRLVEKSLSNDTPYAVVFCDMRMPGWDGLETIQHIRQVDPRCEIVFVTAYSDQDVASIIERVGGDVGYFLKPFANEELRQMAIKGVLDWNRARELEELLRTVTSLRGEVEDIDRLLRFLLKQLCDWLGTDSAALVQLSDEGRPVLRLGVGRLESGFADEQQLSKIAADCQERPCQLDDGNTYLPIRQYGLAIAVDCKAKLTPDKVYLLRVFLEHASMAIRNSEMHSQLVKSEQLAAVGQAIGFIVHDLKNPLGNIRDLAEVIDAPEELGFTSAEVKAYMGRAVQTTLDLLNDTLEFSRGTAKVDPVSGNWSELLGQDFELVRLDLNKQKVELVVEAADDLQVFLDPNRIFRVIRNLCKNAGEALQQQRRNDGKVTVSATKQNGLTRIRVADNGTGIPDEVLGKLFQPFATQGKSGGTGFGLAIAKQLVEAHRGSIKVDSSNAGTTFTIELPGT
jgi:signal transduction histidine kinase/DNA-binding NarL/FixJ family response regulator